MAKERFLLDQKMVEAGKLVDKDAVAEATESRMAKILERQGESSSAEKKLYARNIAVNLITSAAIGAGAGAAGNIFGTWLKGTEAYQATVAHANKMAGDVKSAAKGVLGIKENDIDTESVAEDAAALAGVAFLVILVSGFLAAAFLTGAL